MIRLMPPSSRPGTPIHGSARLRPVATAALAARIVVLLGFAVLTAAACGKDGAGPDSPGPLASLNPAPGNLAEGVTGDPLDVPPAVIARDAAGRRLPGVEVRFTVGTGGGAVQGGIGRTDNDGIARVGSWQLGPALGEQTLVAVAHAETGEERQAVVRVSATWRFTTLAAPLGDPYLTGFRIHPDDPRMWYAMSIVEGLSVSTDAGETWVRPLWEEGLNQHGFAFDPGHPDTIFAGVRHRLLVSGDRGLTWAERSALDGDLWIRSIEILSDGILLVAPQWPAGRTPGVFRSEDRGLTWAHHPFGTGEGSRILTWVLREQPTTGTIWAGNEIADHPQPYRPPFLASSDGGRTWQDVTARLPFAGNPWHVIDVAAAGDGLYALTEGSGLFRSADGGATWANMGRPFAATLMTDPRMPGAVFGGDFGQPFGDGIVAVSFDHGTTFRTAGRIGHNIAALALTGDGRGLVVASWGGGIRVAQLPESAAP
jgi:photosystem II stability/assembly factor-like uncharacterized protein